MRPNGGNCAAHSEQEIISTDHLGKVSELTRSTDGGIIDAVCRGSLEQVVHWMGLVLIPLTRQGSGHRIVVIIAGNGVGKDREQRASEENNGGELHRGLPETGEGCVGGQNKVNQV